MQTLLVHMRRPQRLWRDLGVSGAAAFYVILGGAVAAALIQPIVLAGLAALWLAGVPLLPLGEMSFMTVLAWLHLAALTGGYAASAVLGVIGLKRRRLLGLAGALAALPVLWLMLSLAAWRAVWQLLFRPQLWEKTQHGLGRSSRRVEALNAGGDEMLRHAYRRDAHSSQ